MDGALSLTVRLNRMLVCLTKEAKQA